jgi:two-component system, chemotaxis family, chemotaxis protein CheY
MKILVVDDSKAMRMIVKRNVSQIEPDAEFIEAENGAQALELLGSEQPVLVLCDWNMPEMNGIEFLKALRAQGSTIPFGFVTSETQPAMREAAIAAGAQAFLAKPFTGEAFQELLTGVV